EPAYTADAGYAGWPPLAIYALAGVLLGLTAPTACMSLRLRELPPQSRAYLLIGLGAAASVVAALLNAKRLLANIADPLGPALWMISMLVLLGYALLPLTRRLGWAPVWPASAKTIRWRWLPMLTVVILLVI